MNYLMDANPAEAFINSDGDDVAYLGRLATAWDGRGFRTDKPLSDDEWQRLINLVAAAPAMLASLIECRDWLVAICDTNKLGPTERGYLEAATSAIAKAEGRAE